LPPFDKNPFLGGIVQFLTLCLAKILWFLYTCSQNSMVFIHMFLQVLKKQYYGTRSQEAHGAQELPKVTCGELLFASTLDI
jgi:hypothetical protein